MKFTPDYNVMYKGVFYEADETFEIDEQDAEEMRKHGEIEGETNTSPRESENPDNKEDEPDEKPRQRGRPKREA